MLYTIPAIFTYGIITSIISDKIGEFLARKTDNRMVGIIISGLLHLTFGFVLFFLSLGAALLFFITDRILLSRKKDYKWSQTGFAFCLPFVILIGCTMFG
ncbi:MAG: hypothetical protein ABF649_14215 [Bacillus sp. (in: firmicutes)]